jgi:hypothetical protein
MKTRHTELRNDRQWKSVTGLSQAKFEYLAKLFKQEYKNLFGRTKEENLAESPKAPQIETEEDLLFLLLFSLKTGMTEDVLGLVFGIERSTFSKNRAISLRVLSTALFKLNVMPKREFASLEEFENYLESHPEIIIDSTEHRVQRPDNQEIQKECYSGKKNAIQ